MYGISLLFSTTTSAIVSTALASALSCIMASATTPRQQSFELGVALQHLLMWVLPPLLETIPQVQQELAPRFAVAQQLQWYPSSVQRARAVYSKAKNKYSNGGIIAYYQFGKRSVSDPGCDTMHTMTVQGSFAFLLEKDRSM